MDTIERVPVLVWVPGTHTSMLIFLEFVITHSRYQEN
jgi:hypothetical protein